MATIWLARCSHRCTTTSACQEKQSCGQELLANSSEKALIVISDVLHWFTSTQFELQTTQKFRLKVYSKWGIGWNWSWRGLAERKSGQSQKTSTEWKQVEGRKTKAKQGWSSEEEWRGRSQIKNYFRMYTYLKKDLENTTFSSMQGHFEKCTIFKFYLQNLYIF